MTAPKAEGREGPQSKIICPGFGRTGTTTLAQCLNFLGFNTLEVEGHWYLANRVDGRLIFNGDIERANKYGAFLDSPIPLFYKDLLSLFPNSCVILTVRPIEDWLVSMKSLHELQKQWWKTNRTRPGAAQMKALFEDYNRQAHGAPWFERKSYAESFESHYSETRQFLRSCGRPVLEIDITVGFAWKPICDFLEKPIPPNAFPHRNQGPRQRDEGNQFK